MIIAPYNLLWGGIGLNRFRYFTENLTHRGNNVYLFTKKLNINRSIDEIRKSYVFKVEFIEEQGYRKNICII